MALLRFAFWAWYVRESELSSSSGFECQQVSPEVQGATLEALITTHPAGRAAALLQQRAYKVKGKEGMALRQRITTLEEQATGMHQRLCMTFLLSAV